MGRLPSNMHPLGRFIGVEPNWGFFLMVPAENLGPDDIDALAEVLRLQDCYNCVSGTPQDGQLSGLLKDVTDALGSDADAALQLAVELREELGPPPTWPTADEVALNFLTAHCIRCEDCCAPLKRAARKAKVKVRGY